MKALDWSNLLNHKLILLYIIHKLPGKFTRKSLVNFVLANGLMNYFLVNQYSLDLVEAGLVEEKEEKLFPSPQGDQAFHFFIESLSPDTIETLDVLLERARAQVDREEALETDLEVLDENDVRIHLKLRDQGKDLAYICLAVSSVEEGEKMIAQFRKDPNRVYQALFTSLKDF